jgi:hypothetical protein
VVYAWWSEDARVDGLKERADWKKESRAAAFLRIWEAAHAAAGIEATELRVREGRGVPFLSEPWYCCAEPTRDQLVAIGGMAAARVTEKAVTADGFV